MKKLYIFILLALLISLQFISIILRNRSLDKTTRLEAIYLVFQKDIDSKGSCLISFDIFNAVLANCGNYQLGERLKLSGSLEELNDKKIIGLNRLKIQSIYKIKGRDDLGSYLIFIYFNKMEIWRNLIQKRLQFSLSPLVAEGVSSFLFSQLSNVNNSNLFLHRTLAQLEATSFLKPSSYMSLLIGELTLPFRKSFFTKKGAWLLFTFLLMAFETISGFTFTFSRVVIMSGLQFLGLWSHRQVNSLFLFGIAFFFLWIYAPFAIFNKSFQFSFLSGLGIRLLMPIFGQKRIFSLFYQIAQSTDRKRTRVFKKFSIFLKEFVFTSLIIFIGAQLFTLPLLLHQNHQFSFTNFLFQGIFFLFLPTLLFISLICLILAIGFPLGLRGVNLLFLGPFNALPQIAQFTTAWPHLELSVTLAWWQVMAWWAGMLWLLCYLAQKRKGQIF